MVPNFSECWGNKLDVAGFAFAGLVCERADGLDVSLEGGDAVSSFKLFETYIYSEPRQSGKEASFHCGNNFIGGCYIRIPEERCEVVVIRPEPQVLEIYDAESAGHHHYVFTMKLPMANDVRK